MVLDYILVVFFDMGVSGVAWATFIAQGIAGLLSVLTLLKHIKMLPVNEKSPLFSLDLLKQIARISVPSILQQSFVSVGNVFIQKLINGYGSSVIAGFSAAFKLNIFTVNCLYTFGNAVSSFTAQNFGAKKYPRIRESMKYGSIMVVITGVVFAIVHIVFNVQLIELFMEGNSSAEAVESGSRFLKTVAPFYTFVGIKLVCDGILRGTGSMKLFVAATFTDLILRVVLAFLLSPILGYAGIWWAWPIGWTVANILSLIFYFHLVDKYDNKKIAV